MRRLVLPWSTFISCSEIRYGHGGVVHGKLYAIDISTVQVFLVCKDQFMNKENYICRCNVTFQWKSLTNCRVNIWWNFGLLHEFLRDWFYGLFWQKIRRYEPSFLKYQRLFSNHFSIEVISSIYVCSLNTKNKNSSDCHFLSFLVFGLGIMILLPSTYFCDFYWNEGSPWREGLLILYL